MLSGLDMAGDKTSTRENIITAAFSFYSRVISADVSLSMIAGEAGITKAAIYKHFSSKSDLEEAMRQRIYEDIINALPQFSGNDITEADLSSIIYVLLCHKEYVFYSISEMKAFCIDETILNFGKRGIKVLSDVYDADGNVVRTEIYEKILFMSSCIINFIVKRNDLVLGNPSMDDDESRRLFAGKVARIVLNGLEIDSGCIDDGRIVAIDGICRDELGKLCAPNKFFIAISDGILDVGLRKLTVEGVARRLGLAKSSMYSKFESKSDMITSIVIEEFERICDYIIKCISHAANSQECLYFLLEAESEYFMANPEVLLVCKWLQFQASRERGKKHSDNFEYFVNYLQNCDMIENLPDLGLGSETFTSVVMWLFMVPVFNIVHGKMHGIVFDVLRSRVKSFYRMICGGCNSL